MGSRLTGIPGLQEKHAQRVLGGWLVGLQGQGAGQDIHCALAFANAKIDLTQILQCFRRVRVELNGTVQVPYRLGKSPILRVGEAQEVMHLEVVRV